jgi:hypothetical protein
MANALALNGMGMSLMTLGAPAIAGIIYAWAGPGFTYDTILVFNASSLIFSALLPSVVAAGTRRNVFGDLKDALRYAAHNGTVIGLLLIALGTTMFANAARNFLPAYVDDIFGKTISAGGPETVGWMLAVFGLGAFIGSLFIAGLWSHIFIWIMLNLYLFLFPPLNISLVFNFLTAEQVPVYHFVFLGRPPGWNDRYGFATLFEEDFWPFSNITNIYIYIYIYIYNIGRLTTR